MKTGYAPNFIPAKTGKKLNTAIISCPTSDWHMVCAVSFDVDWYKIVVTAVPAVKIAASM